MENHTATTSHPAEADHVLELVQTITKYLNYYIIIALIYGTLGNVISIVVFVKNRKQDRASASYLAPLALFDLINVGVGYYHWTLQNLIGYHAYPQTAWGCWILLFLDMYPQFVSAYLVLVFALERALVIWLPLKMAAILTNSKRRQIVLAIAFTCLPLMGFICISEGNINGCPPRADAHVFLIFMYWFLVSGITTGIPCIGIIALNVTILMGLKVASRQIDRGGSQKMSATERRCLINLAAVSACYVLFMGPYSVTWSISAYTQGKVPLVNVLTFLSTAWAKMNSCINSLLYSLSLKYFRDEVVFLLSCGRKDNKKKTLPQSKTSETGLSNSGFKSENNVDKK